MGISPVRTSSW